MRASIPQCSMQPRCCEELGSPSLQLDTLIAAWEQLDSTD